MNRLDMLRTASGLSATLLSLLERANTESGAPTVSLACSADAQKSAADVERALDLAIREEKARLAPSRVTEREPERQETRT